MQLKISEFKISITPTKDDVNKLLVLVKESVLSGIDTNSKESVQTTAQKVTTNLANDPGATDDGVVVKK